MSLREELQAWETTWHEYVAQLTTHGRHTVTHAEHERQRALVAASNQLSPDRTERGQCYVIAHTSGGWKHRPVQAPATQPRP